jgi:hypothetical protein
MLGQDTYWDTSAISRGTTRYHVAKLSVLSSFAQQLSLAIIPSGTKRPDLGRDILDKREALGEQGPFRGAARGARASDRLLPQFPFNFDVLFAAAVQAAQS